MQNVTDLLEFLNEEVLLNQRLMQSPLGEEQRQQYEERATKLQEIREILEKVKREEGGAREKEMPRLNLTPRELKDLPEDVLNQLSISDSDKQEFEIVDAIERNGGMMSLDMLIVTLYRETKKVWERSRLNAKLYRMSQKGLIRSVPGKKAVYSTEAPD